MNIKRSHFLTLAAALAAGSVAAGGCIIKDDDDDGDGGDGGDGNSAGTSHHGGNGGATAEGGAALGGFGGATAEGGAGGGIPCDDSVGTPGDCFEADDTACGTFAVDYCTSTVEYFKPRVAENAVDCILTLGNLSECDAVYDCAYLALAEACPDSTADDLCVEAMVNCPNDGLTLEDCHALVDGLDEDGRASVQLCVDGDCYTGGYLTSCIEGLGF